MTALSCGAAQSGENDQIFGSVSVEDIQGAIELQTGRHLDKKVPETPSPFPPIFGLGAGSQATVCNRK